MASTAACPLCGLCVIGRHRNCDYPDDALVAIYLLGWGINLLGWAIDMRLWGVRERPWRAWEEAWRRNYCENVA